MRIDIIKRVDIAEPIQQGSLQDTLFYGDEYAHRIIAEVWKNGAKVDLTGAGVQGYVVRSDGVTIALTGRGVTTDDDGNTCRAYIDLLPDCYAVEGRATIFLKITGSTEITTVLALWARVAPSYTDAIQTVTDTLPDLSDVLAKLDAVETATAAANAAAAAASAVPSVRYDVPQSLTEAQQEQARENIGIADTGLSDAAKTALLDCFAHVAWIDEHGQTYYNALRSALYAQSYPKLTAVFNPGLHVVYTDDALDTLREYLTVKRWESAQDSGTVVTDYTLSGTLVDGLSTVLVRADGLITAVQVEAVDFYNIHVRSVEAGSLSMIVASGDPNRSDTAMYPSRISATLDYQPRRNFSVMRGKAPYYEYNKTAVPTQYYPIPVPSDANKFKVTMNPSGHYIYVHLVQYDESTGTYGNSIVENRIQWTQLTNGVIEKEITNPGNLFMIMNSKYDSAGQTYPTSPRNVTVEFLEV